MNMGKNGKTAKYPLTHFSLTVKKKLNKSILFLIVNRILSLLYLLYCAFKIKLFWNN